VVVLLRHSVVGLLKFREIDPCIVNKTRSFLAKFSCHLVSGFDTTKVVVNLNDWVTDKRLLQKSRSSS